MKMKRGLAFALLLCAALFLCAMGAGAAQRTVKKSGSCGDNVTWTLYSDGELVISGAGSIKDYSDSISSRAPWYNYKDSITSATIENGVTRIGLDVFSDCSSLTSVVIPDSVTRIGDSAFYNCSSLTSVVIPDSVTRIGNDVFFNCSSLTSVVIPDSVTSIGSYAFSYCSSLTNIVIPDSVTSIGYSAFFCCSSLTGIEIPEGVTSIDFSAFSDCSSLTSVVIPDSVTSIGERAFYYCSSLTSVVIPDSVTRIGSFAFSDCSSLTDVFYNGTSKNNITFSNGNTILEDAFWHYVDTLTRIVSVKITECSNGSISLGKYAMTGETIEIQISSEIGYLFDGLTVDHGTANGSAVTIDVSDDFDTVTIGAGFRELRPGKTIQDGGTCGDNVIWTLYDDGELVISGIGGMTGRPWNNYVGSINSVTIENGVTSIGSYALDGCSSLTSVGIPDSVTSIGDYAFYGCSKLSSAEFCDDAPKLGSSAFPSSTVGKFVIYYHAGTSGWTSPTWNGYPAYCVEEVIEDFSTLDGNNRNAQSILFTLNDSASTAVIGNNSTSSNSSGYGGSLDGEVIIPETVIKDGRSYRVIGIGANAFSGNLLLKKVTLGNNISTIDSTAFQKCPSLAEFAVKSGNTRYSVSDGILFDKMQYFLYCYPSGKTDATFTVPDSVLTIGACSITGPNLREVIVPDTVSTIYENAFYNCTGLESITLPFIGSEKDDALKFATVFSESVPASLKTVTITGGSLKWSDFQNCSNLESIHLPVGITTIRIDAFSGCSSLRYLTFGESGGEEGVVVIPAEITTIEQGAFTNCTNLTYFSVDEANPAYCNDKWGVLYTKDMTTLVSYPCARPWPYYNVSAETETIVSCAFTQCANLMNLFIPATVTTMQTNCIRNSPGMTLCVYKKTPAAAYAQSNNLTLWYMDNYTAQSIEIYSLPDESVQLLGAEDFSGLYLSVNYGGKDLQLDDYTLEYDMAPGMQTVTVRSGDFTATFDIMFYGEARHPVNFGAVFVPDTATAYAAVYGTDGRMLSIETVTLQNGEARITVPDGIWQRMDRAQLMIIRNGSFVPYGEQKAVTKD